MLTAALRYIGKAVMLGAGIGNITYLAAQITTSPRK